MKNFLLTLLQLAFDLLAFKHVVARTDVDQECTEMSVLYSQALPQVTLITMPMTVITTTSFQASQGVCGEANRACWQLAQGWLPLPVLTVGQP